jgi:hypothetical protein
MKVLFILVALPNLQTDEIVANIDPEDKTDWENEFFTSDELRTRYFSNIQCDSVKVLIVREDGKQIYSNLEQ